MCYITDTPLHYIMKNLISLACPTMAFSPFILSYIYQILQAPNMQLILILGNNSKINLQMIKVLYVIESIAQINGNDNK